MDIKICSRKAIQRLLQGPFPSHTAVISFCDSLTPRGDYAPVDYSAVTAPVFRLAVDDFQTDIPEADSLAEFICRARADGMNIICQCESGQSRSAGCAAAILEYFSHKGRLVFDSERYRPDELVYESVLGALGRLRPQKDTIWW